MFWDVHHCDCITQSRKNNWARVQLQGWNAQGMELDEAKFSLENPM
jgi:hypothetical protein